MSVDLAISTLTGDFSISGGKLVEATGLTEVTQRIRTRVKKQLGEWRYNLASGVPWNGTTAQAGILGGKNVTDQARALISGVIAGTDGVTSVNTVQVLFDTVTRSFTVQAEIATIFGVASLAL